MAISKPYNRIVRPLVGQGYQCQYTGHPAYANSPSNYTRAFLLIQEDLLKLFEYVEPSTKNLSTYSFRIMELLLRACTELEANFKAILRANTYTVRAERDWNITDYHKIEKSHFLSEYEVRMPYWAGRTGRIRKPFKDWSSPHELTWYKAYNSVKHDRVSGLEGANLENIIDAVCGLAVILAAQYWIYDFSPNTFLIADDGDEFEGGVGGYFRIKFPQGVTEADSYDFDWSVLEKRKDPFVKFNYDVVP